MRQLFLLGLSFFISFQILKASDKGKPQWVTNADKSCMSTIEVCVVGEATSTDLAKNDARKEMALFFQTNIKSMQKVDSNSKHETNAAGVQGGSFESTSNELSVATDKMLEGITIKEEYKENGRVYVLASLDKRSMSARLEEKMGELDTQLKDMIAQGPTAGVSLSKVQKTYDLREAMNLEYHLLNKKFFPKVVTLEDILKFKNSSKQQKVTLFLDFAPGEITSWVPKIRKILSARGISLVASEGNAAYIGKGQLEAKEEYLNVKGFVKYSFNLEILFQKTASNEHVNITKEFMSTGRDKRQAQEKVKKDIEQFLEEELNQVELK